MDGLSGGVGHLQGQVAVSPDLHVHIYPVAKQAGIQGVQAQYAGLGQDGFRHLLHQSRRAGVVGHLPQGVRQDVPGGLQDEQADDHAGHGVQSRKAQPGAQDAREAAYGGQRVGAVVPSLRLQGAGVDLLRRQPGVPEHGLLHHDGDSGCNQGQRPGYQQFLTTGDLPDAAQADAKARGGQNHTQDQRRHALQPLVTVGMVPVGVPARQLHAQNDDEGSQHIRRFGKRPRAVVYIDGPFYPDQTLSRKEAQNKLHDEIQKTLVDRAKLSDYEYCQYIKK